MTTASKRMRFDPDSSALSLCQTLVAADDDQTGAIVVFTPLPLTTSAETVVGASAR